MCFPPSSPSSLKPGTIESSESPEQDEQPDPHPKRDTDTYVSDDEYPYTHTIHDTHSNCVEHTTSAVWNEELQGLADTLSLTEDLESWRIMEDLQKQARAMSTRLRRHPDKLSSDEYERMHILADRKQFFTRAPLDGSEYVLIEWQTASEFADTLTFCSKDMEDSMAHIPDPIS
jgi:hypothetical protein